VPKFVGAQTGCRKQLPTLDTCHTRSFSISIAEYHTSSFDSSASVQIPPQLMPQCVITDTACQRIDLSREIPNSTQPNINFVPVWYTQLSSVQLSDAKTVSQSPTGPWLHAHTPSLCRRLFHAALPATRRLACPLSEKPCSLRLTPPFTMLALISTRTRCYSAASSR
jgi:hypothetical protein